MSPSERRSGSANGLVAVAIGAVLIVAFLALGGVRSSTVSIDSGPALIAAPGTSNPVDPTRPEGPRVRGGSQSSGWSVLGFSVGGSTSLSIEVPVSPACYDAVSVDTAWPPGIAACDPALPIDGTIVRRDTTSRGPTVVVEIPASNDCYAVAAAGAPWPTGLPQCASEEAARAS